MYKILFKYLVKFNLVKTKFKNIPNKLTINGKLRKNKIKISGDNNLIEIGAGSLLRECSFYLKGNNNKIIIGKNCVLHGVNIIMDNENSEIVIGESTSIAKSLIVSLEPYKIIIGKDCMISYDVEIRNTDSHMIYDLNSNIRLNTGKEVIIKDNVWIGTKCLILKGSNIDNNSIVAAGSIVNKEFSNNCIIAGNPAKVIKNNVYWTREEVMKR